MPKQPADIQKSKRIQVIKDTMMRYGAIDKKTLTEMVSNSFDCEAKELSRVIYRDLNELVTSGQAEVTYYTRGGALIDDFDDSIHKNYFCKWTLLNSDIKIIGEKHLKDIGGQIWVNNIFNHSISIHKGDVDPSIGTRHLYLGIGSRFLCVKISLADSVIPISFFFSREMGNLNTTEIQEVQKVTKRAGILKVPIGGVSSYKEDERLGHFSMTLSPEGKLELMDLGSTNGTSVYKLSMNDADRIRLNGEELLGEKTVSESWNTLSMESFKKIDLKAKKKEVFEAPFIVQVCSGFRVLVM